MSVPASYIAVIVIWSTTPLAIQWSGDEVGYQFGVAARMVIGLALLLVVIWVRRLPLPFDKHARSVYLLGGIPIVRSNEQRVLVGTTHSFWLDFGGFWFNTHCH